jgi:hypothetical protein
MLNLSKRLTAKSKPRIRNLRLPTSPTHPVLSGRLTLPPEDRTYEVLHLPSAAKPSHRPPKPAPLHPALAANSTSKELSVALDLLGAAGKTRPCLSTGGVAHQKSLTSARVPLDLVEPCHPPALSETALPLSVPPAPVAEVLRAVRSSAKRRLSHPRQRRQTPDRDRTSARRRLRSPPRDQRWVITGRQARSPRRPPKLVPRRQRPVRQLCLIPSQV